MSKVFFRRIGGRIIPLVASKKIIKESDRMNRLTTLAKKAQKKVSSLKSFAEKAAPENMGGFYGKGLNELIFNKKPTKSSLDILNSIKNPIKERKKVAKALKKIRGEASLVRKTMSDPRNRPSENYHYSGVTLEEVEDLSHNIYNKKRKGFR